jgi:hypothetical protein
LTQGNDQTHTTPITRVEVNTGKWTLWVQLAPTGSDATEYHFRLQEVIKLGPHLLCAPLNWIKGPRQDSLQWSYISLDIC